MDRKSMDIAVVGTGALFAGARSSREFWSNILRKVEVLREIPRERWDWRLYYDSDRFARDRIYTKWGGFIDEIPFDPLRYGIPPNSMKSVDPIQLLTLETVRQAIEDAGYHEREFDRENTSVILGATVTIGDMGQRLIARSELPQLLHEIDNDVLDRMPEWSETSMTGYLLNVLAGRVANRMDLGGTNQTVDAACASGLAAVAGACRELRLGEANVAIAGSVDAQQSPFTYLSLCKAQAISPNPFPRPFDKNADGIVLGEGIGAVVLKRLEDAIADGDGIYAVIKGHGSSSDGRAKSLFSPNPRGQKLALKRAYEMAGVPISSVGLFIAHGTGTTAGDQAEVSTVLDVLAEAGAQPNTVLLHSNKAQIGHTKGSAGMAGLIEACHALHQRQLPPQMQLDDPLDVIVDPDSPVFVSRSPRPWVHHPNEPRRAAVSAFGFGGTNFHVVLEQPPSHEGEHPDPELDWPHELILFKGENRADIARQVQTILDALDEGAEPRVRDIAYTLAMRAEAQGDLPATLATTAGDLPGLRQALSRALPHLIGQATWPVEQNLVIADQREAVGEKVAFLFPGHGSQFVGQGRELALCFPEFLNAQDEADQVMELGFKQRLSQFIYPPSTFSEHEAEEQDAQFKSVFLSISALQAYATGVTAITRRLGLAPDMAAGHSLGETSALVYAGAITAEDGFFYMGYRQLPVHMAAENGHGGMLAVNLSLDETRELVSRYENVFLSNHNTPEQVIIGGKDDALEQVTQELNERGIRHFRIGVYGAWHTPYLSHYKDDIEKLFKTLTIHPEMALPVYDIVTGEPFEQDKEYIRDRLAHQFHRFVDWVKVIEQMYADGARVFVELGPKAILTKLQKKILSDRPHWSLALDSGDGTSRGFLLGLGKLVALGVDFHPLALFDGRHVRELDLNELVEATKPPALRPTTWFVNGGAARPMKDAVGTLGKRPALTLDDKEEPSQTSAANTSSAQDSSAPPPIPDFSAASDPNAVMAEYQARMARYLEQQEEAMRAYLAATQRQP